MTAADKPYGRIHFGLHLKILIALLLAVAGPPAIAEVPIAGYVLGIDGRGARGVELTLEPMPTSYEQALRRLDGQSGAAPVARTRTDAEGFFELAAPRTGMWVLVAEAPGHLTMEYRLEPLVEARDLPALALVRAESLQVRVRNAEGQPLPATVGIDSRGRGRSDWRARQRLARTGEGGVAQLPRGREEKLRVAALAPGYPRVSLGVDRETSVRIEIGHGETARLRVTDSRSRPIPEALAYQGSGLLPLGLSDTAGRLDLAIAGEDPAPVRILTRDSWSGVFDLTPGNSDKPLTLKLDPPTTVYGRVIDLESRDPLRNGLVWGSRGEIAWTDARGGYALRITAAISGRLRAAAAGYRPGVEEWVPGVEQGPTFALQPAAGVSGKVVDGDGWPVPGVDVRVIPRPPFDRSRLRDLLRLRDRQTNASRHGRFQLAGLPAEMSYVLRFAKEGFAPARLEVAPLKPFENRSGLEVVLRAGRLGVGRVVDPDGEPIAGAAVRLERPPPGEALGYMMMERMGATEPALTSSTDAEGRFEIPDQASGTYDLRVSAEGFAPATVPGLRVGAGGGEVDLGTVVLSLGAVVEGRVEDLEGRPVAGAEVRVEPANQPRSFGSAAVSFRPSSEAATSDGAGRFVLSDLLPGQPVTLTVIKAGYSSELVSSVMAPTGEPLEVILRLAARLSGRVLDRDRRPVEDAWVWAQTERERARYHGRMEAWTDADGSFAIEDVEAGPVMVMVRAPGYQRYKISGLQVPPGGEHGELEIVLERGAVVEGTVRDTEGKPVIRASVHVMPRSDGSRSGGFGGSIGSTDAEGRFRIDGVPLGPASVEARHRCHRRALEALRVEADSNRLDLTLETGFEVSGRVVDPEGHPVGAAAVSLRGGSGEFRGTSAADGTSTFTGVAAGHYTLAAAREGFAQAQSEPFDVESDVWGLELRLERGATLKGRVVGLELDDLASLVLTANGRFGDTRRGRVDYSAKYVIPNLGPGVWSVQAELAASGRTAFAEVVVEEGATEVWTDIELGTGFTLSGVAVDGGVPLAGAYVLALGSAGDSGHATTDSEGRFGIEDLDAGTYRMTLTAGGAVQHAEEIELSANHEVHIEIATARISGVLRDAFTGLPIVGAAVKLAKLDGGEGQPLVGPFSSSGHAQSDSRGRFTVQRIREGSWRLTATKPGYAPAEALVELQPGVAEEIDLTMDATEGIWDT